MSVSELIPEIWSKSILRNFEKTSIFASYLNRDYMSDLGTGDRVHIPRIAPVEARTYDESVPLQYDDIQSSTVTLELTQRKYFAIKAGDVSQVQANAPFLQSATKNAGYALRDTIDVYSAATLAAGAGIVMGSDTAPIVVNTNAFTVVSDIAQRLNENDIPLQNRFLVVHPWFYKKLIVDGINLGGILDTSRVYADGFIGKLQGFDLYISNNVPKSGVKYSIIADTNESGSLIVQIDKIEKLRDKDSFSDLVRGLAVYGAAVTQPTATARVFVQDAA